jgi:two-component sensor histidine kinase
MALDVRADNPDTLDPLHNSNSPESRTEAQADADFAARIDAQLQRIAKLRPIDRAQIRRIEAALPITADVSRADLLLYVGLSAATLLVIRHVIPRSISSHYPEEISGRTCPVHQQPLVAQALTHGRGGRRQLEVVSSGAPVLQDVFPVYSPDGVVIAALVVETNLFAYERHRRRDAAFRQAIIWLQTLCMRGDLRDAETLSRFGLYDGVYLVDRSRTIAYMSGVAVNFFRSIGLAVDMEGQQVGELEADDNALVDEVLQSNQCVERRHESPDGRVWIRKAIPLTKSPTWHLLRLRTPRWAMFRPVERTNVDAVLVLIHNATDAVAKQRELNVKSAIIQEVHHRVKNNLQLVAAMLRIQARRVRGEEARQQLSDAVNRILSVAVIHEFLSEDEHQPINIRDLCQRIALQVSQVAGNPDQEIAIDITGPNIRLPASQATPVAMVLNELVLNALEHGLSGHSRGRITIDLAEQGNTVCIAIRNSGSSLPADFDPLHSPSLGLQIVQTLVRDDLKGELTISSIPMQAAPMQAAPMQAAPMQAVADPLQAAGDRGGDGDDPERDAGSEGRGESGSDAKRGGTILHGTEARVCFPKRSLKVD